MNIEDIKIKNMEMARSIQNLQLVVALLSVALVAAIGCLFVAVFPIG